MEQLNTSPGSGSPAISDKDFLLLRNFIKEECGINISPSKRVMLTLRLQKRLRALDMGSFRQYIDFITTPAGRSQEIVSMLDVVSTNKTDFFREFSHFDYLSCEALPQLMAAKGVKGKINVWSAGCSSGEEPYTIAMVMTEFAESNPELRFNITASDISMKALRVAVRAVYPDAVAENIPSPLKRKYTLRGTGQGSRPVSLAGPSRTPAYRRTLSASALRRTAAASSGSHGADGRSRAGHSR